VTALAIDGPAGAGKSTVARAVASALGWRYVDSGAMYRAIALAVLRAGADAADDDTVGDIAEAADVDLDGSRVWLDGDDVSDRVRASDVTKIVSTVAANPRVRAALLGRQRAFAATSDVVMEGRDIGSAVLPEAEIKVYLTAAASERARRRALEQGLPQDETTLAAMQRELSRRDVADATREVAPLARPEGAHEVDTTGLTLEEVVERICAIVGEHRG
jgi:cytidylate kinase